MNLAQFVTFIGVSIAAMQCTYAQRTTKPNQPKLTKAKPATKMTTTNAYSFELTTIDGAPLNLAQYKGKKILIVNTASACGYTPQYEALEKLYKQYSNKLVVVGVPANNFGGQEPGTNSEIKGFCTKNYGVTFPLTSKVDVVGANAHPLFSWLTNSAVNGGINATIKWNFTKFLIDEQGNLIANYPSSVAPLDNAIVSKL